MVATPKRKQKGNQRIIHQILFDIGKGDAQQVLKDRPEWRASMEVNKKLNPSYRHILWNDNSANKFVDRHYPEYKGMIRSFPHRFYFIDFFRYLVLAKMGGIYIDMDVRMKRALPKDIHTVIGGAYTRDVVNNNVIMLPDKYAQDLLKFSVEEYNRVKSEGLYKGRPGRHFLNSISMYMFRRFVKKNKLKSQIPFRKYFLDEEAGSWSGPDGVIKKQFVKKTDKGKYKGFKRR